MKFSTLVLSSFLFSGLLAMTALSVNWDDPSYDADEMFHSGEEEVYQNPVGAPATPQESRKLQENNSSMNWTMPSTLGTGGESAKESREEAQSSSDTEASSATEGTALTEATSEVADSQTASAQNGAVDVQGNWFFTLNDSVVRDVALALFQNGEDVYGSGKIKEGNSSMDVTVSGAASGSNMNLNLVSTNPVVQYKLNLTLDQDWAAGEFNATSAGGESWMGTAEGQKTA